jgi:hypothetical protein
VPIQTYRYWMPEQGALLSQSEGGAPLYLDAGQLESIVRANTSGIPVGWFVGMAEREIGGRTVGGPFKWNEVASDFDENGYSKGADTYGLFQLRTSTMISALSLGALDDESACDPATNAAAFSRKMGTNLLAIQAAAPGSPAFDTWCYLAWSHNAGLGDCLPGIVKYGLDWEAAKTRNGNNAWFQSRLIPYAEHIAQRASDIPDIGSGTNTMLPRLAFVAFLLWGAWKIYGGSVA